MDAMDMFQPPSDADSLVGSLARALQLDDEPESIKKLYSPTIASGGIQSTTIEDAHSAKKLLLARRLVQAGVRCVSVSFSDF